MVPNIKGEKPMDVKNIERKLSDIPVPIRRRHLAIDNLISPFLKQSDEDNNIAFFKISSLFNDKYLFLTEKTILF